MYVAVSVILGQAGRRGEGWSQAAGGGMFMAGRGGEGERKKGAGGGRGGWGLVVARAVLGGALIACQGLPVAAIRRA